MARTGRMMQKPAALIKKHNSTKWQPKAGSFMNNGKSMAPVDLGLEIQRGVENWFLSRKKTSYSRTRFRNRLSLRTRNRRRRRLLPLPQAPKTKVSISQWFSPLKIRNKPFSPQLVPHELAQSQYFVPVGDAERSTPHPSILIAW